MSLIRVGLCLIQRRYNKLKFQQYAKDFASNGFEFILIDMDSDIEEQGPFDVIIHKIPDFNLEKRNKLQQFAEKHEHDMIMIDSVELAEKMTDRVEMTAILKSCELEADGIKVFVPKSVLIKENTSLEEVKNILRKEDFSFPILTKPLIAACNVNCHDITIIFAEEFLTDMPIPCIIQEFCNHGGILYKVYMMGESYRCCQRPSIKNLNCSPQPSLFFDTRTISRTNKPFQPGLHGCDPKSVIWKSSDDDPNMLNRTVIQEIIRKIRRTSNISLAGIDIIIEEETGNYGIIDLNYFPGYDGVGHHFVEDLSNFLKHVLSGKGR